MSQVDLFLNYFSKSSFVTIFVLSWLSIYFILTFTVFFSKALQLAGWLKTEKESLESMLFGSSEVRDDSILRRCATSRISEKMLDICISTAEKNATAGLSLLSVIASTSPFIGLFGTVVSILETFSALGSGGASASISIIAPAISEALVATAGGIFVAIPAYTFHIFLKRKSYEYLSTVQREADVLISYSQIKQNNQ